MATSRWTHSELPNQEGRSIIVTGANSGIGRVAASALARAGAAVTLAVRDVAKGETAAAAMAGTVSVRPLDLADLGSVRNFAEGTHDPFDVLIDNAGVMAVPKRRTVDGFEMQIGTNHLGHFALTNLLVPLIRDRIVVVTSELHRRGRIELDDLNWERRRYKAWDAYAQSKLANLLFVFELERRLRESGSSARAVAVHPGYAATNLQSHTNRPATSLVMSLGNRFVAQSDAMGALPTLYGAVMDVPAGSYIGPDGFRRLRGYPAVGVASKRALDADVAARLWDLSEHLTGVTWPLGLTN
jgi:NAD(P)-dependent dehydrogenase (short-subunit alcohol dehydrogenase family)